MYIDAKSARCWKYLPTDTRIHFPPGSTYQPNRNAVATGLSLKNTLCTRAESNLPILMENNKNHQLTQPEGRIGFSSLDVVDRDEPKYQIRSPYELTNAIISADERYNDCFLLHSTVPAQSSDEFLKIIYGKEESILQQPNSIGHCISADARMSKGFADFLSHRIPGLRSTCRKARLFMGQVYPFWDSTGKRYIYNLVTKERKVLRLTESIYIVQNVRSNENSCKYEWHFYYCYTQAWLWTRSNELARSCETTPRYLRLR